MHNFFPFLIYILVTSFTPGPNNIMSMSNARQHGYKRTLGFLAGIFFGFLIVMLVCGISNMAFATLLPQVKFWLNILGAIYMGYLAFYIIFSKSVEDCHNKNNLNSFLAGFTMQFLNFKVILYGITIYSLFIIQAYQNPIIVGLFAPLLAIVCFIATFCWALGGHLLRDLLHKYNRQFNIIMGVLLIYTAIVCLF